MQPSHSWGNECVCSSRTHLCQTMWLLQCFRKSNPAFHGQAEPVGLDSRAWEDRNDRTHLTPLNPLNHFESVSCRTGDHALHNVFACLGLQQLWHEQWLQHLPISSNIGTFNNSTFCAVLERCLGRSWRARDEQPFHPCPAVWLVNNSVHVPLHPKKIKEMNGPLKHQDKGHPYLFRVLPSCSQFQVLSGLSLSPVGKN